MSNPERPQPRDVFGFTRNEELFDLIGDQRFRALLADEETNIHHIALSGNTYGEFLFVTVSRPAASQRLAMTFWGLGYHDYRERWFTDEWRWYQTQLDKDKAELVMSKDEALALLDERLDEIAVYAASSSQSRRGQLFEMMADLTDDDGAWADIEDMGDFFDE